MDNVMVDRQNLEIAIQTVLHHYHSELELATKTNNSALIQQMAGEITRRAKQFQTITEHTMIEMEDDDDEL